MLALEPGDSQGRWLMGFIGLGDESSGSPGKPQTPSAVDSQEPNKEASMNRLGDHRLLGSEMVQRC